MTLRKLLEEKKVFRNELGLVRVYLNPTKEEINKLEKGPKDPNLNEVRLRWFASMPNPNRHYFYIWNANESNHNDVIDEMEPDQSIPIINGYAEIKNGKIINRTLISKKWSWIKQYTG
jgi:hypothetical protein